MEPAPHIHADGTMDARRAHVRRLATADLDAGEVVDLRALLFAAFPPGDEAFTEDDWQHTIGGMHVVLDLDGRNRRARVDRRS